MNILFVEDAVGVTASFSAFLTADPRFADREIYCDQVTGYAELEGVAGDVSLAYDLAVVDLSLASDVDPALAIRRDCLSALALLAQERPKLPVLIYSGLADGHRSLIAAAAFAWFQSSVKGFLSKSADPRMLARLVPDAVHAVLQGETAVNDYGTTLERTSVHLAQLIRDANDVRRWRETGRCTQIRVLARRLGISEVATTNWLRTKFDVAQRLWTVLCEGGMVGRDEPLFPEPTYAWPTMYHFVQTYRDFFAEAYLNEHFSVPAAATLDPAVS